MFTCDACLRRALYSLTKATHSSTSSPWNGHILERAIPPTLTFSRNHATLQSLKKGVHRQATFKALGKTKKMAVSVPKPANSRAKFDAKQVQARENNRLKRLEAGALDKHMKRSMQLEVKYLVDPLKLAQETVQKLRDNQLQEAHELVRASDKANDGKGVENIVSWNHIIDWLMSKESPGEAWKVYNELKKRGHKPDSHTYTIMLKGYRVNHKRPNVVQQAMSVYDSISAANSAVTVNVIHTNALLSVCARAHDTDALWKVVGRLPERGPGAPDHVTFTTILQGLSNDAQKRAIDQGAREGPGFYPQHIFDQLVEDARKIWLDITARWRRGLLHIDEVLVCAMGRLLMLSDDRKAQMDVFNLVHQTMNLPRMASGTAIEPEVDAPFVNEVVEDEQPPSLADAPARVNQGRNMQNDLSTVNTSVYAKPGTNTLSMVIETAAALRELKSGKYFWDLLTSKDGSYKLEPDHQNVMAYLRLLRISRASKAVLDLLREPRSGEVKHSLMVRGTFIIAMSTCLRDKRNPNVFETASRIMDIMQESTEDMSHDEDETEGQKLRYSPRALRMYLEVAISTTKGINGEPLQKMKGGDLDFERDPSKNHTLRALRRLGPNVLNIKQMMKSYLIELEQQAAMKERTIKVKQLLDTRRITPYSTNERIPDLVDLLSTMISAYDKIIIVNEKLEDEGMGPLDKEILEECWLQKRKLGAFVSKYGNATAKPGQRSDDSTRRFDERGHTLPQRNQMEPYNLVEDDEASATTVPEDDMSADSDLANEPSIPPSNPRQKIFSEIQTAQARIAKKSEERGLSRRQKLELIKKENIRAQFPASMLREKETPRARQQKDRYKSHDRWSQDRYKSNDRYKPRDAPVFGREGEDGNKRAREFFTSDRKRAMPVWKASQLKTKHEREVRREQKTNERGFSRPLRDFSGDDQPEKNRNPYPGWGGGFQELVREVQRDGKGIIQLGP